MNDATIVFIGGLGAATLLGAINIIYGGDISSMLNSFTEAIGLLVTFVLVIAYVIASIIMKFLPWIIIGALLWHIYKK